MKSFMSTRNNDEKSTSRGPSEEKLKKTTTLYNKAQNDLLKKLKQSTYANTARTIETPQANSTVNIQKFLQGSMTSTHRNPTPKTPTRNLVANRVSGNLMSTSSNTNSSSQLKKPEVKASASKTISQKPVQETQAEISKLFHWKIY